MNVEDYIEEEEGDDYSEESGSSSEGELIDETVREDMQKLEETFEENGMKFRLIDRIGEGIPRYGIKYRVL